LALERQRKTSDARKAHEKAAKLGDEVLETRFLRIKVPTSLEDLHKSLLQAAESAERYIALSSKLSQSKREEWNDRVEYLREYAAGTESGERQIFSAKEVTTKLTILSKPEPEYTEEARENHVTGTIVLRVIFTADSKVRGIIPLKGLPSGLTRMAMVAARKIRFVPATKDGKPVSMYLQLEYTFNIY
jgi:TonB family protein